MIKNVAWGLLLGVAIFASGCGGDEGIGMKTHPVTGTVKLQDGTPVSGARLMFNSADGKFASQGNTDSSGKYTLVTSSDDGAPAGEYTVTITGANVNAKHGTAAGGFKQNVTEGQNTIDFTVEPSK